jgi:eukaryotic-like serine/threonine-protein kinase
MGERFGNYEILRRIAAGGMAEVFLAKQTGLGGFERLVCIKRILPHLGEQEDFIKMFQDEARIAANLIHPNVAQIYDIGQINGAYYIAMEYVRGEDLRRVYNQEVGRGRAMPTEPAAQIAMGGAAGLDYAHRQASIDGRPLGIVHRDVSPQNILITYDGHVKLVDFGVAKAAGKMTETRTGVLKGKYSYMSPEQASGDPIDARTDIFALGVTLYEVTTGVRLFKRDNEIETLHAVIECNVTPPSEVLPGYDSELEAIVMKALQFDPDQRYATAGDLARALEGLLIGRGHPTGALSLGAYMQDLFAEKLADELLFGGQGASEGLTPSRAVAATRRVRSGRSASAQTAAQSGPAREDTIIDAPDSQPSSPPSVRTSELAAAWVRKDDWGAGSHSSSQTSTRAQAQGDMSPRQPSRSRSSPRFEDTPSLPASYPNRSRLMALGIAASAVLFIGLVWVGAGDETADLPHTGPAVVESEPRGARVLFLGPGVEQLNRRYHDRGHRTPFTVLEGLPAGIALRARFMKDGFDVIERDVPPLAESVSPAPIFAELTLSEEAAQAGTLIVLSNPSGADVYLDDRKLEGTTPMENVRLRGGEAHKVELRLTGHQSRLETTYVEPGGRKLVDLTLMREGSAVATPSPAVPEATPTSPPAETTPAPEPAPSKPRPQAQGAISITSPLKVRVLLDGRFVGETPLRKLVVDPGAHRVSLQSENEGFVVQRRVRVTPGGHEQIELALAKGNISVNAQPWAFVRVGSQAKVETPRQLSVYEGDYKLVFECPDGKKKSESATVEAGETAYVTVNCRD